MPVKIPAVYWEDVIIPTHLITQHKKISVQEIKHFAATFDPQPYHLDHDAAKESLFGGLCASGWHVCAIMMRLLSDTMEQDSIQFLGNEEIPGLKWLLPVFEDDQVQADITFTQKAPAMNGADFGPDDADIKSKNQHDKVVMALTATLMIKTRLSHGA
jgi:acyl dehydratase